MSRKNITRDDKILPRLREIITAAGDSKADVARKTGYSKGQVGWILEGKTNISDKFIRIFCSAYNISEQWINSGAINDADHKDSQQENTACETVDIYSMVEAGVGAEPEWHEPVDRQAIPSKLLRVSIKPVLVRGRSMEPSIMDGAIIGVDLQDKQVVEGEVYAIMLPYVGAAVKRLYPLPDGVLIRSDNKEFPEVKIRREEIQDHFILGKVKWVLQEF